MITRYLLEVEHEAEPVEGDLLDRQTLISNVLHAIAGAGDDDVDVGVIGVRVKKVDDDH